MRLKTILTPSALFLAAPALAQDQTRQQSRDPASRVDGTTATRQRIRSRDASQETSRDQSRERSRATSSSAGKGSGAGAGGGHDSSLLAAKPSAKFPDWDTARAVKAKLEKQAKA
jgi:hypothetical protein